MKNNDALRHSMGYDIYSETEPEYRIKYSIWEWDRLLLALLWSKQIYTTAEFKTALQQSVNEESSAKAAMAGEDPVDFDMEEFEGRIPVRKTGSKETRPVMNVSGHHDKSGRYIFNTAMLEVGDKVSQEAIDEWKVIGAISLNFFQKVEDRMFKHKSTLPHLYGIQSNQFDLSVDACWDIYDLVLNTTPGIPDIIRGEIDELTQPALIQAQLEGQFDMFKGELSPKRSSFRADEALMEEIVHEYFTAGSWGKNARLFGIVVNGIMMGEKKYPVIIR